ncbi:hypothetical protein Tco_0637220 [Tanacetum coccineum]
MDTNRRSSKRQQKIPNHFQDSVHDLNKQKGSNKARGPNVMNKKDDVCLDQANREGLEDHDIQGDAGDKIMGCNEETKGIVLDSEVIDVQNKDDGIGGVENDGKVNFGSVNDDMIRMCDGISNENGIRQKEKQGVKETEQGNKQEVNNVQGVNNVQSHKKRKNLSSLHQITYMYLDISEVVDMQNEDDGIGVEGINGKVNFGSVNDDMIRMCYGTSKDIGSKEEGIKAGRKSFVEAIAQNLLECDKTLESIPTEIDENGVEVVVFDDVMVAEGSKRWDLTLCGFFVGYKMSVNELRKPLVVQKGSVDLNLDNTELERIPLWVKLCNVPLEAWIVKGIARYARVLIEVSAKKILANDMEIVYKNAEGKVQCKKSVKVEYDWKPQMCSECGVFGHTYSRFYKNVANINTKTELEKKNKSVKGKAMK